MRLVSEIELVDYGVDNAQYFQGHGVSYTEYQHSALGVGDTFADAIENALEQLACDDFDSNAAEAMLKAEHGLEVWPETINAHDGHNCEDDDACEMHYYVGLRWNEG